MVSGGSGATILLLTLSCTQCALGLKSAFEHSARSKKQNCLDRKRSHRKFCVVQVISLHARSLNSAFFFFFCIFQIRMASGWFTRSPGDGLYVYISPSEWQLLPEINVMFIRDGWLTCFQFFLSNCWTGNNQLVAEFCCTE